MTGQLGFFDQTTSESKAAPEIRKGSPKEWIDRVQRGLCAKCGEPRGEPHPEAHLAVNRHLANKLCPPCWEKDRDDLTQKMNELEQNRQRRAQNEPEDQGNT